MMEIVNGVFRGGHIELARTPSGAEGTRVLVTFLDTPAAAEASDAQREQAFRRLVDGMLRSKMTGGRGYVHREELYGERVSRYDR